MMRAAVLRGPRDIRLEEEERPAIVEPADAILRVLVAGVSEMWVYRGTDAVSMPRRMGHEYVGVVEQVGADVRTIRVGDVVVGSFTASDGNCAICLAGFPSECLNGQSIRGAIADYLRVPLADGTLVSVPGEVGDDLFPGLLAASDVLGTAWYAADAAHVSPGDSVAIVGDGAVGLLAVMAAAVRGAEQIIISSRHEARRQLAMSYGATDVTIGRGDDAVRAVRDLTEGFGADCVIEAVGTQDSMMQAMNSTRIGGHVGVVGVPHDVQIAGGALFSAQLHVHGGSAPVRRYLPELIDLVTNRTVDPGGVFDLSLPLEDAAEAYEAMDQRRALKAILRPSPAESIRPTDNRS